ncbi:IMPACT family protein [Fodinibius sediminis]|uniref:Uncharacterized protein, YigZ family n=1 Tax=Fodinibius sediminis TaxID=1214077 RepID=A0A521CC82_9BACT|nr:YigZ family protein [Fodinibius sediminis]SMO56411.1 uncharacterized protein, YigZ family [Fodinibius sediminis]
MQTVQKTYRTSFREKGSKFIGFLFPALSQEDFNNRLSDIKSDFPDATHHCYGWRIDPTDLREFAQDDGEPGGTAGLPILNQLKSYQAVNCGCVVVRYYGGTNLGKSGLINAYGAAAERCLAQATFVKIIPTRNFIVSYSYELQNHIEQLKNSFDLKELNATYLEKVTLTLACRAEQSEALRDRLQQLNHLGIEVQRNGPGYIRGS